MSLSSDVVVIDIGSRSICAYAAERISDDAFSVRSYCETEYDGYTEGRWNRADTLLPSICKLLDKTERTVGQSKTVYVGIPADFCIVRSIYDKISFPKAKRITRGDLEEIYETNDPFSGSDAETIAVSPILFLDDKGERLSDPIGHATTFLKMRITFIGVKKEILDELRDGITARGVKKVAFIPSEFAAARELFSKEEREVGILLADIGYTATSILHLSGDALLEMRTFALGGSMIPVGLANRFDMPYRVASAFVPRINLGYKDEGDYSMKYDASTYVCPVGEANAVTKECIDCIALYLSRAIESFKYEVPLGATLYVTGGGLCDIRLAREYLAKALGRRVEFVQPTTPSFAKPYFSTAVGLIREAIAMQRKERFSFLRRLFNI